MTDEELDVFAGEYVLGTLTAEERGQASALAAAQPDFAARIAGWERRLGALEAMVVPLDPPREVWDHIRARIGEAEPEAALRLPEILPWAPTVAPHVPPGVADLSRRLRFWRRIAVVAVAVAVVLLIAYYRPDLLPFM